MSKMFLGSAAALALVFSLNIPEVAAQTKEQTDCPDTALVSLLNMRGAAEKGDVKDINQVFQTAEAGLTRCTDDPNIQAVTATLFVMIGENLPADRLDDRFTVYSKAYKAFENHDKSFDQSKTPVEIPVDGDDPLKYYSFNDVGGALKTTIGRLAELKLSGKTHKAFDLRRCPYEYNSRIDIETDGYRVWLNRHGKTFKGSENPEFDYRLVATQRLEGIWEYCTTFRRSPDLSFTLATYYLKLAQDMKDTEPERALDYAKKAKFYGDNHANSERGEHWAWAQVGGNSKKLGELLRTLTN